MPTLQFGYQTNAVATASNHLATLGPMLVIDVCKYRSGPIIKPMTVSALIDTGSYYNAIDVALVNTLGMIWMDSVDLAGAHGVVKTPLHLVQYRVPGLNFVRHGRFAALDFAGHGAGHQVILGRPFLSHFTFNYDGPNGALSLTL